MSGVGFYIKNCYTFSIIVQSVSDSAEQLWLKINIAGTTISVGIVYRPGPAFQTFLDEFEEAISVALPISDEFICLGDFNIDALNVHSYYYNSFLSLLESYGLSQIISQPTRVTLHSSTLIDFIIINDGSPMDGSGVLAGLWRTFLIIAWCLFDFLDVCRIASVRTFRDFNNIDIEFFDLHLRSIPWETIFDLNNIDAKLEFLNNNLNFLLDCHAPLKSRTFKHSYKPWITHNIRLMISEREKARKKFLRTGDEIDGTYYRQLRNYVTYARRQEQKAYFTNLIQHGNGRQIWSRLKGCGIVACKKNEITNNSYNADEINEYFKSVQSDSLPDEQLLNYYASNVKDTITGTLEFHEVTEFDIWKAIDSISSNAVGYDGISLRLLKLCCPLILHFLRHIFNFCFEQSVFPTCWKISLIKPIPKTNNVSSVQDLRPISILSVLGKVFEKLMAAQLDLHLKTFNILPQFQSGFRAGYGCSSALLRISDDIFSAIDCGKLTALVLLDYSRAFDTINHELLLAILNFIGLGGGAVALFAAYITDRIQLVCVEDNLSDQVPVISGVPQGSILGPMLYTIYSSFIYQSLNHCQYHAYADDTQIYHSFSEEELISGVDLINADLGSLVQASKAHNLLLNTNKCSVLLFGNRQALERVKNRVLISIDNKPLPILSSARNLGVIFDSSLRFKSHISSITQKSFCVLRSLYSARDVLPRQLKIILCDSLILSKVNYCDVVYGPCLDAVDRRRIQRIQNSCLRYIYGLRRRDRVSHLIRQSGWLGMAERRSLHAATMFHRIIKTGIPSYLTCRIRYRTDVHNINVRRKDFLTIPKHRLEYFKRSFSYCIALTYNKIPAHLKSLSTLSFKLKLRQILIDHQIFF